MSIIYNSSTPKTISLNGSDVSSAIYNETTVFVKNTVRVLYEFLTGSTGVSVVPPPYDHDGYNFNDRAPLVETDIFIDLHDIGEFDKLTFTWDNEGSGNAYGEISASYYWNNETHTLFNSLHESGYETVSFYSGQPTTLQIHLKALSQSSYRYWTSHSTLNLYNVRLEKS